MTTKGRAVHMLNNARARAKRAGVGCTITQDWIEQKLKIGVCEVTGLPFELKVGNGKGHRNNPFSPSLDRISQKQDYSPDNVRMTCWIYNRARGAFSDVDFDRMIEALINKFSIITPHEGPPRTSYPQSIQYEESVAEPSS